MKIDRRRMLALLGMGAASPAAAQASPESTFKPGFGYGVASGDPLQDRVVIWTRVGAPGSPDALPAAVEVDWELARDSEFRQVVRFGKAPATPERDFTVKADVVGLEPGTDYFYRFRFGGRTSPVGRTRTLPSGATTDVVLAVASCALYPAGYFNAYQAIADLPRVDAVLHLGDYIYEYGGPGSYGMDSAVAAHRPHDPPREIVSLADYRVRHAQYKSDPALQAAHARAPWIVAWDDHETANDSFVAAAQNHQPEEGDWNVRKAAALKAYYEWMPIRDPAPGVGMAEAANRAFQFGDLVSLIMLETRLTARDGQLRFDRDLPVVDGRPDVAAFRAKLEDPARRMLSPAQEAWVAGELAASVEAGRAWQVLGNQVVMARRVAPSPQKELAPRAIAEAAPEAREALAKLEPLAAMGLPYALDMWDGYPAARERFYDLIRKARARPIVVSGDSHAFWANELHDAGGTRVACEFGATGITSPGAGDYIKGIDVGGIYMRANPEVVFSDQSSKGFVLLTLTREDARAELVAVSTVSSPRFDTRVVKTFRVRPEGSGLSRLTEA